MVKLVFLDKQFDGQVYELTREKTTVGRTRPNDLVIPSDSVSASHCEVLVWGNEVIVRDLDSANGTFVDGFRLNKQSGAKSGQVIRFGSVEARLEIDYVETNDDNTDLTAIHEHSRAVRALQQEKRRPAVTPVTLKSDELEHPEETTVLLKPNPPLPARTDLSRPEPADIPVDKPARKALALKATLAVLGLGLLLWLLLTILRR